jgi:hypothetical protein
VEPPGLSSRWCKENLPKRPAALDGHIAMRKLRVFNSVSIDGDFKDANNGYRCALEPGSDDEKT